MNQTMQQLYQNDQYFDGMMDQDELNIINQMRHQDMVSNMANFSHDFTPDHNIQPPTLQQYNASFGVPQMTEKETPKMGMHC